MSKPGNVKQVAMPGVAALGIPLQRGKKFRLAVISGASTYTVNAYLMTADEATALGVTRQKHELVASSTSNLAVQLFDIGFAELEVDLTTFVGALTLEFAQFTPAQSA